MVFILLVRYILGKKPHTSICPIFYKKKLYVKTFSFELYVPRHSVNFCSLVKCYFCWKHINIFFYSLYCRASIIRWQYVTLKSNDDALKESVGHLATKYPKQFPETHVFIAEIEVFKSFFNSLTEENRAEVSKTIECATTFASDIFHKQHLFPSVHIGYLIYFGLHHLLTAKVDWSCSRTIYVIECRKSFFIFCC